MHIFLTLVLGIFLTYYSNLSPYSIVHRYDAKDTTIEVRGNKLHFVISRAGQPTILLESGGGADATQWNYIQKKLAETTNATVISYDRPGYGSSDLPDGVYDISREVEDLHQCLKILGTDSLIIVNHSYGSFLSQAYQFAFPEKVKSLILIDPNNVLFVDSIGVNFLSRISFDTTSAMTKRQRADLRQTLALSKTVEAVRAMPFSRKIPITVVTAGKNWWPFPQWNLWWQNSHKAIIEENSLGRLVIAEGAAHDIPNQAPDLIIGLIKEHFIFVPSL